MIRGPCIGLELETILECLGTAGCRQTTSSSCWQQRLLVLAMIKQQLFVMRWPMIKHLQQCTESAGNETLISCKLGFMASRRCWCHHRHCCCSSSSELMPVLAASTQSTAVSE
jgi:hypothetical protein